MLSTTERLRLERALPSTFEVSWEYEHADEVVEQSATYEPPVIWTGGEVTDDEFDQYPVIVFDMDARGEVVDAEDTVVSRARWETVGENDDKIREDLESPQADTFSVTVAVERKFKDGIPPQVRAEQLTDPIWQWAEQVASFELNEPGENAERSMTVETTSSPTPQTLGDTYRIEFSIVCQYTSTYSKQYDAVDDFETEVGATGEED